MYRYLFFIARWIINLLLCKFEYGTYGTLLSTLPLCTLSTLESTPSPHFYSFYSFCCLFKWWLFFIIEWSFILNIISFCSFCCKIFTFFRRLYKFNTEINVMLVNVNRHTIKSLFQYYFAVDNSYVSKKLGLLLMPFLHKDWSIRYNHGGSSSLRFYIVGSGSTDLFFFVWEPIRT